MVFTQEPAKRPYGIEAVFRDDSGNWFSLTQHTGGSGGVIARVAAAVVAVADQDVMLEFFVGKLGFTTVMDREMWPGARWVEVAPPGSGSPDERGAQRGEGLRPRAGHDLPDDVRRRRPRATAAELRAAGVEVSDVVTEPWGSYIRVTDPEGRQLLVKRVIARRAGSDRVGVCRRARARARDAAGSLPVERLFAREETVCGCSASTRG